VTGNALSARQLVSFGGGFPYLLDVKLFVAYGLGSIITQFMMSLDAYNVALHLKPAQTSPAKAFEQTRVTRRLDFIDITELYFQYRDDPDILRTPDHAQAKKDIGKFEEHALLVRRKVEYKKGGIYKPLSTKLEVRDDVIQNTLRTVLSNVTYLGLQSTPLCIPDPYRELFWFRKEISRYREQNCTGDEEKSYALLSHFMEQRLDKMVRTYDERVSKGIIDYKNVWMVFRPGSLAVSETDGLRQAFLIRSFHDASNALEPASIRCLVWACDTNAFGTSERTVQIERFSGTHKIVDLPVYPFEILPEKDQTALFRELIERGRRWKTLIDMCYKFYKGTQEPLSYDYV